jgi:hypothetical protein
LNRRECVQLYVENGDPFGIINGDPFGFISENLESQIPLIPLSWLGVKTPSVPEAESSGEQADPFGFISENLESQIPLIPLSCLEVKTPSVPEVESSGKKTDPFGFINEKLGSQVLLIPSSWAGVKTPSQPEIESSVGNEGPFEIKQSMVDEGLVSLTSLISVGLPNDETPDIDQIKPLEVHGDLFHPSSGNTELQIPLVPLCMLENRPSDTPSDLKIPSCSVKIEAPITNNMASFRVVFDELTDVSPENEWTNVEAQALFKARSFAPPLREVNVRSERVGKSLVVLASVQGQIAEATIDSAAQVTVLSRDFAKSLPVPLISTETVKLKGAGKDSIIEASLVEGI